MVKKIVFVLLGCVTVAFIAVALWWVSQKERGAELPKESFVPYNSAVVMNVNGAFGLSSRLKEIFGEEEAAVRGKELYRMADSLRRHGFADTSACTLALRVEGRNAVRRLMVLDCGNLFSRGKVYSFLSELAGGKKGVEKEYDGHRICRWTGEKGRELCVAVVGSMILLSDSGLYMEDALRQLNDKRGIADAKPVCFEDVSRYFSATAGINLYLNESCFSDLLPLFVDTKVMTGGLDAHGWFKWGAFDVNMEEEGINLNGFLNYDDMRKSFPAVFKGQRPVAVGLDEVLPSASKAVSLLGVSDVGERRATERAVRSKGARPLPTTIQTAMPIKGKRKQSGCRMRNAAVAASSVRTATSCATVMISGPALTEYVRQVLPSIFSSENPGPSGSGLSHCKRNQAKSPGLFSKAFFIYSGSTLSVRRTKSAA